MLADVLVGRVVRGAAIAAGTLDLAIFFEPEPLRGAPLPAFGNALRIALGNGKRRRMLLEQVRWSRDEHLDGDNSRALEHALIGTQLVALERPTTDLCYQLRFAGAASTSTLLVELFGGSGNWFLLDDEERILALAKKPSGQRSMLTIGARFVAAPRRPDPRTGDEAGAGPRRGLDASLGLEALDGLDGTAVLERVAQHYAAIDRELVALELLRSIEVALARETKSLASRRHGLEQRRSAEARAEDLRREGELLLASRDITKRGLAVVRVTDWYAEGSERDIEVDPKLDVRANAERRFERARALDEGRAHTERELSRLDSVEQELTQVGDRLAVLRNQNDEAGLEDLRRLARDVASLARPKQQPKTTPRKAEHKTRAKKPYREYTSLDGTKIWVGRGRTENDQLTLRHARGNDVWLHIGGGIAGSHVVVRLDRNKTASLETLLDAATLALWFSKARGRPHAEVLYTPRKHVRKPKGFAAGLVEVLRSKTLALRFEPERLSRLLDTAARGDSD